MAELLRAHDAYGDLCDDLFYWAPAQGSIEVDVLLQCGRELVAIEVKATLRPRAADVAGLRAIAELPAVRRRILVHTGPRAFNTEDGAEALPVAAFADQVASGRL